jgi:hypothetical protein
MRFGIRPVSLQLGGDPINLLAELLFHTINLLAELLFHTINLFAESLIHTINLFAESLIHTINLFVQSVDLEINQIEAFICFTTKFTDLSVKTLMPFKNQIELAVDVFGSGDRHLLIRNRRLCLCLPIGPLDIVTFTSRNRVTQYLLVSGAL